LLLHKGQFFSVDIFLSVLLFLTILTSFFATHSYLNRTIESQEVKNDMTLIANSLSSSLVDTGGYPDNWETFDSSNINKNTVPALGLSRNTDGGSLDQDKVNKLVQLNSSYSNLKDILGIKGGGYEFYLKISGLFNLEIINNGGDYSCNGQTINGNVQENGNVAIQDCTVNGNVQVDDGKLKILRSVVTGNVILRNSDLEMAGTNVDGNLQVNEGGIIVVSDSIIDGNLQMTNGGSLYAAGNSIGGNLEAGCSTTVLESTNNDVEGDIDLCNGDGAYEIGIYPGNAENVVIVERYVLLKGNRTKVNLMVWENG